MSHLVVGKHRYFCRMRTLPSVLGRQVYLLGKGADRILRLKGLHERESRNILGWYSNAWGKCSTVNSGSQQVGGSRPRVPRPASHQQQDCLQHWLGMAMAFPR